MTTTPSININCSVFAISMHSNQFAGKVWEKLRIARVSQPWSFFVLGLLLLTISSSMSRNTLIHRTEGSAPNNINVMAVGVPRWRIFTLRNFVIVGIVLSTPHIYGYLERRRVYKVLLRTPPMPLPLPETARNGVKEMWDRQIPVQSALTEKPGNLVVLAGEPGSGKSTILKSLFQEHTSVLYNGVLYFHPADSDDFAEALADLLHCTAFYKPNWFRMIFFNIGIIPAHSVATTSEELLDVCLQHLAVAAKAFTAAQGTINGRPTFIVELGNLQQTSPVLAQKLEAFGTKATAEGFLNVILVKNKQFPSAVDSKATSVLPANVSVVEVPDLTAEQAWQYMQQRCTASQLQAYPETKQFIEDVAGGRLQLLEQLVDWIHSAKGESLEVLRKDMLTNCLDVLHTIEVEHVQAVSKVVTLLLSAKDGHVAYQDMLAAVGSRADCKALMESKAFSYHSYNRSVTFSSTAYKTAAKDMHATAISNK